MHKILKEEVNHEEDLFAVGFSIAAVLRAVCRSADDKLRPALDKQYDVRKFNHVLNKFANRHQHAIPSVRA